MKNRAFVLLTLLLSGCYTTKVYTPAPSYGPEHSDRQWFTIGGLVPLSEPTGEQCPGGVSRAESKLGVVDVLINVGLAVAGGVAGAVICSNEGAGNQSACSSGGAALLPFLLAARTVQYNCAGAAAAAASEPALEVQPATPAAPATPPSPAPL